MAKGFAHARRIASSTIAIFALVLLAFLVAFQDFIKSALSAYILANLE
jgi:hypothetical protein